MNNSDMPIAPLVNDNGHPLHASHIAWDNKPLALGLTKREHFAGLAMQGILANSQYEAPRANKLAGMAIDALAAADALLAELDKE